MLGKIIQNLDKAKSMAVFSFSVKLKLCLIDLKEDYFSFVVVVQFLSCIWFFVTLIDCSTSGSSVLHDLPEFAQIHVHQVSDVI